MGVRSTLFISFLFVVVAALVTWFGKQTIGDVKVGLQTQAPLILPEGFQLGTFAQGLNGPRDLEFSPNGTLLVSLPSQGRVMALPDHDKNGVADEIKNVITGLKRPHGLAFYDGKLFVAEEEQVVRYQWNEVTLTAFQDKVLFSLPSSKGGHYTRSLVFDKNGRLFVSIGSTCNVCREEHEWLASVIVSDADGNHPLIFAKGLRNAVFMAVDQSTNRVWTTEMGRDLLGDDIPPDEINNLGRFEDMMALIVDKRDWGWPFCYGKNKWDREFTKDLIPVENPCRTAHAPIYEIPAHSAPLGLTFIASDQFPSSWQGDLLVSYHGSWNRSMPSGYKVVRLDVEGDTIKNEEDFLTGFLPASTRGNSPGQTYGRPVDLIFDKTGSLYISDDKAGIVYKVVGSKR